MARKRKLEEEEEEEKPLKRTRASDWLPDEYRDPNNRNLICRELEEPERLGIAEGEGEEVEQVFWPEPPEDFHVATIDAACLPPDPAFTNLPRDFGMGICIRNKDCETVRTATGWDTTIHHTSSEYCEMSGMMELFRKRKTTADTPKLIVSCDNLSTIQILNQEIRGQPYLRERAKQVIKLAAERGFLDKTNKHRQLDFKHIYREQNWGADRLAHRGLRTKIKKWKKGELKDHPLKWFLKRDRNRVSSNRFVIQRRRKRQRQHARRVKKLNDGTCPICKQVTQHSLADCPERGIKCLLCDSRDHKWRDCPDLML